MEAAANESAAQGSSEPATLGEALDARAKASSQQIPTDAQKVMKEGIDSLLESGIEEKVIASGTVLPDAKFLDVKGNETSLYEHTKGTKSIVTFYRGGWCPYCNLQLHYYQEAMPEITKLGGKLIAITPETPDNSLLTTEKNELAFPVLSDKSNAYARELGLVFKLSKELAEVYKSFGIDLEKANGDADWELPLSATFVTDEEGKIVYRFVEADYKKRASVDDILAALK